MPTNLDPRFEPRPDAIYLTKRFRRRLATKMGLRTERQLALRQIAIQNRGVIPLTKPAEAKTPSPLLQKVPA